jgi:hypothetical protein
MNDGFIIAIILGEVLALASLSFWFYWLSTLCLVNYARSSHCTTGALFATSATIQLVLLFVVSCVSAIPFVGLVVIFGGLIGWIVLGVKRYQSRAVVRQFRSEYPLPKMQCSMIDIYTGVLFFALAMTACTAGVQAIAGEPLEAAVFPVAAYFLVVTYLGFYASLDVLRRAATPSVRWGRFLAIVGIMLIFTFSFIVGGLIAWRAWQKALQTMGLQDWRKARFSAKKLAAGADVAHL